MKLQTDALRRAEGEWNRSSGSSQPPDGFFTAQKRQGIAVRSEPGMSKQASVPADLLVVSIIWQPARSPFENAAGLLTRGHTGWLSCCPTFLTSCF